MSIIKDFSGHGKDVILLHGWATNHYFMQPIAHLLSDHYQLTNIDLPGCGKSTWLPKIKTLHDMADAILPYMPKKAIYIGWSIGGLLAISIASRYPERVERIIGIATTPKFMGDEEWPGVPYPGLRTGFPRIKKLGLKKFFQEFCQNEFRQLGLRSPAYQEFMEMLEHLEGDLKAIEKGIDLLDTTDFRKEFQKIRCPIDLFFGECDETVPIKVIPFIQKLNPTTKTHIIKQAHHAPFWTHQNEFRCLLKGIL